MPCRPSHDCGQADTCARRIAPGKEAIDASAALTKRQAWCPMFIDRRGLALIGVEIPVKSPNPHGRPRSATSLEVERVVIESAESGLSLEQLREALAEHDVQSVRHAAGNLKDRGKLKALKAGRLIVYFGLQVSDEAMAATLAHRLADIAERRRAAAERYSRDYYLTVRVEQIALRKARAQGAREEAQRLKAEMRRKAEEAKKERQEQRQQERARRLQLTAAKRAEHATANRVAKRLKSSSAASEPANYTGPVSVDWSQAKVIKCPTPPLRFEVRDVLGPFSSMRPGQYAFEPASCAARAAA